MFAIKNGAGKLAPFVVYSSSINFAPAITSAPDYQSVVKTGVLFLEIKKRRRKTDAVFMSIIHLKDSKDSMVGMSHWLKPRRMHRELSLHLVLHSPSADRQEAARPTFLRHIASPRHMVPHYHYNRYNMPG